MGAVEEVLELGQLRGDEEDTGVADVEGDEVALRLERRRPIQGRAAPDPGSVRELEVGVLEEGERGEARRDERDRARLRVHLNLRDPLHLPRPRVGVPAAHPRRPLQQEDGRRDGERDAQRRRRRHAVAARRRRRVRLADDGDARLGDGADRPALDLLGRLRQRHQLDAEDAAERHEGGRGAERRLLRREQLGGELHRAAQIEARASCLGSSVVIESASNSIDLIRGFLAKLTQSPELARGRQCSYCTSFRALACSSAWERKSPVAPSTLASTIARPASLSARCRAACFSSPRAGRRTPRARAAARGGARARGGERALERRRRRLAPVAQEGRRLRLAANVGQRATSTSAPLLDVEHRRALAPQRLGAVGDARRARRVLGDEPLLELRRQPLPLRLRLRLLLLALQPFGLRLLGGDPVGLGLFGGGGSAAFFSAAFSALDFSLGAIA